MSIINIKSVKGGNNQFGDHNNQYIITAIDEIRRIIGPTEDKEVILSIETLESPTSSPSSKRTAADKILTFVLANGLVLSEMAGAFLKGLIG